MSTEHFVFVNQSVVTTVYTVQPFTEQIVLANAEQFVVGL